jgi:hypothetical protein
VSRTRGTGRSSLRGGPRFLFRRDATLGSPKGAVCRVPVESCGRRSEERRSSYPDGVVRPVRRSAPFAVHRWAGCACPKWAGTDVRGRGFNTMMLRSAEADPHVIEHMNCSGAEAPKQPSETAASMQIPKHPHQSRQSDHRGNRHCPRQSRRSPTDRPKAAARVLQPKPQRLRCAASAPTEVGRRPSPSKPHRAADFKALLR